MTKADITRPNIILIFLSILYIFRFFSGLLYLLMGRTLDLSTG
ncbi:MAG: hypothetical protein ACTSWN_00330 [Promethearchaeota archaeon]